MMKRYLIALLFAVCHLSFCDAQVIDTVPNRASDRTFLFTVAVPDGNYLVTVTLGHKKKASQTVVRVKAYLELRKKVEWRVCFFV